jgi:hypothetical protein
VYITEPVDRDRAYILNFNAEVFKGDLWNVSSNIF